MKILDLFAGIGGFSLAAHWMNWQTVAFVEKEPFCQKVLRKNFGADIDIHDDIFTFDGRPFRGTVDIITGGFPCQPFSAAGQRKGRADERHLFPQMLRVIREVKPLWVVAENVRGLLSIESGAVFAEVISSLEGEGYEVVTFCVPASAVEAPHRRDRLWIVARLSANIGKLPGVRRKRTTTDAASKGRSRLCERTPPTHAESGSDGSNAANSNGRERSGAEFGLATAHAELGDDCSDAANSERISSGAGIREAGTLEHGHQSANGNRDVSDAQGVGLQGSFETNGSKGTQPNDQQLHGCRREWAEHWFEAATRFCRVDDVVSNRVDRLKALGNAVVPVVVYEIFKAIEAAETE